MQPKLLSAANSNKMEDYDLIIEDIKAKMERRKTSQLNELKMKLKTINQEKHDIIQFEEKTLRRNLALQNIISKGSEYYNELSINPLNFEMAIKNNCPDNSMIFNAVSIILIRTHLTR